MDWHNILKIIPLVAGSVNPLAGVIATALLKLGDEEIERRQAASPGKTRDEIIAESQANFFKGLTAAEALRLMGHET